MGIPIPANAPLKRRDGLYIKAGHGAAPAYLRVEGILCRLKGIPGEEGNESPAVCLGALRRGDQTVLCVHRAAPGQDQTQQEERQPTPLHGATGSPDSSIRPAHSRHRSISSQMRKQASQTSRRQMGHWLNRSLAS